MSWISKIRSRLPWNKVAAQQAIIAEQQQLLRQQAYNLELQAERMGEMHANVSAYALSGESPEVGAFLHVRMAETELITGTRFTDKTYSMGAQESGVVLAERMAELELALEDRNWLRMAAETNREFSRQGLRAIMMLSRFFFLKNPLIRRGVLLQSHYVWGQGMNISASDPDVNEVLQDFMDNPDNRTEMFSHQARVSKEQELQVTGNLFVALSPDMSTGAVTLRTIPADEIQIIHTDPDDAKKPWFYERTWTPAGINITTGAAQAWPARTILYPDYRYKPEGAKQGKFGDKEVAWDTPILHVKVGGLADMRFGTPEYYSGLDYARAYSEFIADWCTITRSYRRYAWSLTTKGGPAGVQSAKAKLGTTAATGNNQVIDSNPSAVTGSTFINSEGVKMEPFKAGGVGSMDEGRRIGLMVGSAMGIPETMLMADVAKGAHATAKTLDRPTELKMRDRQLLWVDVLMDLFNYVIDWAARAPNGALRGRLAVDQKPIPLAKRLQQAKEKVKDQPIEDGQETITEEVDRHIDVDFPAILTQDLTERISAIVSAATLDGKPLAGTIPEIKEVARMLLQELGESDIDELLDQWFPDTGEEPTYEGKRLMDAMDKLAKAIEVRGVGAA